MSLGEIIWHGYGQITIKYQSYNLIRKPNFSDILCFRYSHIANKQQSYGSIRKLRFTGATWLGYSHMAIIKVIQIKY